MAGGRPKTDAATRRTSVVAVRLTVAERAALEARAASAGLPLPDYMRSALVEAAPPRRRKASSGSARLGAVELRELNAIGVNLNQLAKRANAGDGRDIGGPVMAALAELQTIFARFLS